MGLPTADRDAALMEENARLKRENAELRRRVSSLEGDAEMGCRMRMIMERCREVIAMFGADGRMVCCSRAFLDMLGAPDFEAVAGLTIDQAAQRHGGDGMRAAALACARAAQSGEPVAETGVAIGEDGDGRARRYELYAAPVFDAGGAMGLLLSMHDVSALLDAKERAENADRAKTDFIATVSHEIRTPMNAVIGLAGMMKKTGLSELQQEYVGGIENSSRSLLSIINDILDFSKIGAGKLEIISDYFVLGSLLERIKRMFEPLFEQKHLEFFCEFEDTLPEVVHGDEGRIGQILTNLLSNALKYTDTGYVRFCAAAQDGHVRFEVEDSGAGIEKDDISRLFRAFEQLDRVRNKNVVGTGLGLAITHSLCALMGGGIEAQSEYGRGSRFTARLPLKPGTRFDLPKNDEAHEDFAAPNAKILIVDDIEINLMITSSMLDDYGIITDQATNGADAVALAREEDYDMIFMDHLMPDMDGVETAISIRGLGDRHARTPIIALTANAMSGAMEMFMENGFQGFLSKPVDTAALERCLLKWLPEELIEAADRRDGPAGHGVGGGKSAWRGDD